MISKEHSGNGTEIIEYENFGLYPYKTLQDIVARLDSGEYKDSDGHALVDSEAFQELERMAYEPPIPDPTTAAVAGIIYYLIEAEYEDHNGQHLGDNPLISILKLMNVRKAFRSQSEDGLRVLALLADASYRITTGKETKELKNDPEFQHLRKIIMAEVLKARE